MSITQIINHLKKSNRILLASHIHPDGDAIGSLIALGLALQESKKKIRVFNESPIPAVYQFLPSLHLINRTAGDISEYDTAIILDCSDLHRIGEGATDVTKIPTIINIDHHTTNTRFGHLQYIDPKASSTSEMVYRLIEAMDNVVIDKGMAYSIYTGIMADTGSFRFANTTPEAFEISHQMVLLGANPHKVAHHVYETISLNRIKLMNMLFDSIELSHNGKLSIMTLTQNMLQTTGTMLADVSGLINYAKQIENVKLAALLFEKKRQPGRKYGSDFHVSLRSDGAVNVAAIATSFGGGGHHNAAGFDVQATLPDLKRTIFYFSENL